MGFYGNITNLSRTQFVFDKVYPNRFTMDSKCTTDGVYAGRYVLVEYETDFSEDVLNKGITYYYVDGKIYSAISKDEHGFTGPAADTEITQDNLQGLSNKDVIKILAKNQYHNLSTVNQYIRILNEDGSSYNTTATRSDYLRYWSSVGTSAPDDVHIHIQDGEIVNFDADTMKTENIFLCPIGYSYNLGDTDMYFEAVINDISELSLEEVDSATHSQYFMNASVDRINYGSSRVYDSTVWQKVYSNGEEKYVMIAELNTVVPTFDVVADAPTLIPIAPHFDIDSTNIYYKFHWQPQWGLRTKAANIPLGPSISSTGEIKEDQIMLSNTKIYPSDQTTSWDGSFYNVTTGEKSNKFYNFENRKWEDTESEFDAAIYYNKAGFDPEVVTYSADILDTSKDSYDSDIANSWDGEDKIGFSSSGKSGNIYNQHNNNIDMTSQIDTQEFSMMLPSLGDTIANIWDIIYGGRDTNNDIAESSERNLDLAWENAIDVIKREGLRLIQERENGNGYEIEESQVNTVAGAINSIHDLMGMIIVEDDSLDTLTAEEIRGLSDNNIYYTSSDGSFKRKHEIYNYTEVDYQYNPITSLDYDSYFKNYYYKDENGEEIATEDSWQENQNYYKKELNSTILDSLYNEVELQNWDSEQKYYYKTQNGNYERELSSIPSSGINYLQYNGEEGFVIDDEYQSGTLYYKNGSNYILDMNKSANANQTYYKIDENAIQTVLNSETDCFYIDNKFYIYDEENKTYSLITERLEDGATALLLNFNTISDTDANISYQIDSKGNLVPLVGAVDGLDIKTVTLYNFDSNKQYYTLISNEETGEKTYRKISSAEDYFNNCFEQDNQNALLLTDAVSENSAVYYTPNTFYYQLSNKSFIKDTNSSKTKDRVYYILTDDNFTVIGKDVFYIPNKYYYKANDAYVLANSLTKEDNVVYYKKDNLYVLEDTSGIYEKGAIWTTSMTTIPATISLAIRTSSYELAELEGFARELNTIHGLILKINQFIDFGDTETRDRDTVQGALNTLNDYINKFKSLPSNKVVITDGYGRIAGAGWETTQNYFATNWQESLNSENEEIGAFRFINFDLNTNPDVPYLVIKHDFNPVENTETFSNKNEVFPQEDIDAGLKLGNNSAVDSELILETPIVDNMGHVVGKNTETITLPYNFKTLSITNDLITETTVGENGNTVENEVLFPEKNSTDLIAQNAIGTATINAGNKWINLIADNENNIVNIIHAAPDPNDNNVSVGVNNSLTPAAGDEISIPFITVDAAGHISNFGENNIVIPDFGTSINNINDIESNGADLITQISLNSNRDEISTTRNNVGELLLTGYEAPEYASETICSLENTDSINEAFNKIQSYLLRLSADAENIAQIQNQINSLISKIETLESYHDTTMG